MTPAPADAPRLRRPVEADHSTLVDLVDDWWGRRIHVQFQRLWFHYFGGTSVVAEGAEGRPAGFLIGFVSPDVPEEAYLHLLGVAIGQRRRGVGRAMLEWFIAEARRRGAIRVTTTCWPGDQVALRFLHGVGFEVDAGPGTQRLYGTPSYTDWDRQGDDRVVLTRPIDP